MKTEMNGLVAEMEASRSMGELNKIAGRMLGVLNDESPSRGFGRVGERSFFWYKQLTRRKRCVK